MPCPEALSSDEVEWQDFAEWFCILLAASVVYMGLLLLVITVLSFCKPSLKTEEKEDQDEVLAVVERCQTILQGR